MNLWMLSTNVSYMPICCMYPLVQKLYIYAFVCYYPANHYSGFFINDIIKLNECLITANVLNDFGI